MVTNTHSKWGTRLATLALWGLAGASVVFWGLRLSAPQGGVAAPVALSAVWTPDANALARTLGAGAVAPGAAAPGPALPNRFVLQGVLSGRQSGGGAALIAIDGKPAKTYRVGAQVEEGLVLQALAPRQAMLGARIDGPAAMTLDVPRGY